jgi:signal transduction histidine kinase
MNFNTTVLAQLSEEILAHVPDSKKELLMTELRRLDNELNYCRKLSRNLQKNEMIGEILPVIFHKMKNKLTPIMGYSQILLTKVADERLKERIRKIDKNADELTCQFNFLRDYLSSEKTIKVKENLNHILSRLRSCLLEIGRNHRIRLDIETDAQVPDDLLNPGQIGILITDMVDNALQAIKKKNSGPGVIEIRTKSREDGYSLSIKDNGIGIRKEDIPKIWTPFFSGSKNRAGLGLTICEKIIINHGASFTVDSAAGIYCEFVIIFKTGSESNKKDTIENSTKIHQGGSDK